MGLYWVDMNWVLAIYSVTVQSKYPIFEALVGYLDVLLGILSRKINTSTQQVSICKNVRPSVTLLFLCSPKGNHTVAALSVRPSVVRHAFVRNISKSTEGDLMKFDTLRGWGRVGRGSGVGGIIVECGK